MLKRVFLLFFLSVIPISGNTQLVLNQDGEAFTDVPFFNQDVIFSKRIKTIEGKYSRKNTGEIIQESSDWFRYRFDEMGRMCESIDIRTINKQKDTVLHQYKYNSLNQVVEHRKTENKGFTTVKKTYDSLHRLESEVTSREVYSYQKNQVLQSTIINSEFFKHVDHQNEKEQLRCNNEKLPYLNEIQTFNELGYLTEKKDVFLISAEEYKTIYTYDDHGLLTAKTHYHANDVLADEEWKYRYDIFGNLIEIQCTRFGQLQKDLQIIFDTKTQLLGSTISRNTQNNSLLILRFTKYTYYD